MCESTTKFAWSKICAGSSCIWAAEEATDFKTQKPQTTRTDLWKEWTQKYHTPWAEHAPQTTLIVVCYWHETEHEYVN